MDASNQSILVYSNNKLHVFDNNLKHVRSIEKLDFSENDIVDIIWCQTLEKYIILTKEKLFTFDPARTQLASIENAQFKEKKHNFVSCTCSDDQLFIIISKSSNKNYLSTYKLINFKLISQTLIKDFIDSKREYSWSKSKSKYDRYEVKSVRYNHQRLGMIIEVGYNETFLYTFNLEEKPIRFAKIQLSSNDSRLISVTKSGDWLVIENGNGGSSFNKNEVLQISLDCRNRSKWPTEYDSKNDASGAYEPAYGLDYKVKNMAMMGLSHLVLLRDYTISMYEV